MTPVRSGPEWGASQKHRLPGTPEQAERPVSEGPQKIHGQAVRQTMHRVNRCRHGALGLGGFDWGRAFTRKAAGLSHRQL